MSIIVGPRKPVIQGLLIGILGFCFLFLGKPAWAGQEQELVDKADMTLKNLHEANAWLRDHAKEAKAIFIVPSLLRVAFILGGAGGNGVLIVKQPDGNWSPPAFYTMGSASVGLQIGVDRSEIVVVVRTQRGLESFYTNDFRIGGDASMAVGSTGGGTRGGGIKGDFVAFSKSKGVYGGISLDGQGVAVEDQANLNYYGMPVRPIDILVRGRASNPDSSSLRNTAKNLLK
ncbi:MAG: lipid-binding SYLF domain-containing protein [Nitrospirales bacterium]|nr:lipid-binding SYLF domain-containing protein [Nitrospirales bacterium]